MGRPSRENNDISRGDVHLKSTGRVVASLPEEESGGALEDTYYFSSRYIPGLVSKL
jgi:hypothetical protein